MTEHKSFKRLVRARMAKTGESYTAARANLLRAEAPEGTDEVALATSDEAIRKRTGRGWEEWFALLDEWGAPGRTHREIARWVAAKQGVHPLAWNAQAVAASYERARGLHRARDTAAVKVSCGAQRDDSGIRILAIALLERRLHGPQLLTSHRPLLAPSTGYAREPI